MLHSIPSNITEDIEMMTMQWLQKWKIGSAALLVSVALPVFAASSNSIGAAVDDSVITAKVKSSLAMNTVTHAETITVETNNGVVLLKGNAQSETEALKAIEIAESTVGVKNVDATKLRVSHSNQPLGDAYITAKVKGMFVKNNLTPDSQNVPLTTVSVETQRGVVFLSGTVQNQTQIATLTSLAKSVDGVSSVKSTLSVQ
jgi:hyperosmotically inducible protein